MKLPRQGSCDFLANSTLIVTRNVFENSLLTVYLSRVFFLPCAKYCVSTRTCKLLLSGLKVCRDLLLLFIYFFGVKDRLVRLN